MLRAAGALDDAPAPAALRGGLVLSVDESASAGVSARTGGAPAADGPVDGGGAGAGRSGAAATTGGAGASAGAGRARGAAGGGAASMGAGAGRAADSWWMPLAARSADAFSLSGRAALARAEVAGAAPSLETAASAGPCNSPADGLAGSDALPAASLVAAGPGACGRGFCAGLAPGASGSSAAGGADGLVGAGRPKAASCSAGVPRSNCRTSKPLIATMANVASIESFQRDSLAAGR